MTEYIEMERLIGSLEDVVADYRDEHTFSTDFAASVVIDILNNIVKCQPAADVAPVRHGRWLDVQETDMYVPDLKFTATKTAETCSVCRARIGFIGAKLYLFDSICPSCGARMDGGNNDG